MSRKSKSKKDKKGRGQDLHDESIGNYASDSEASIYSSRSEPTSSQATVVNELDDNIVEDSPVCDALENFIQALDVLQEKRNAARIEALNTILRLFRNNSIDVCDCVCNQRDGLIESLSRLIRRPASELEGLLAIDAFAIMCLALGPEEDDMLKIFTPILVTTVKSSDYERVREASVFALAFSTLICASSVEESGIWEFIEDVLCAESEGRPVGCSLQASAASGWCLLASVMGSDRVVQQAHSRVFEAVVDLLCEETDTETKIAAGACLAQMWESADELQPGLDAAHSGAVLCSNPNTVQRALFTLQKISTESSKRISKRDRKEQRAAFRPLISWVLNGERPSEQVQMQGATVECESFSRLSLLDALRTVLKDAFPLAIRVFPTVRQMLDVSFLSEVAEDRSVKGKGGAISRTRTTQRKQDRKYRDSSKHGSVTDEWAGLDE